MKKLLLFAFFLIFYANCRFTQSTKLHTQEVKVLKEIWNKTRVLDWDFDKDPCSLEGDWLYSVDCNCSFDGNTTCRVTGIYLEGNMLSGPFPTTLTKMTTLQTLVLEGNHFSGPLPKEIANLTYMIHLYLYFTFLVSIFML
ncbi:putative non-specific serine/threonine protein kinase [Helianthus annuus]|nr:putative non-specific serine/threonine protein kinase [Helianthus annuus]